MIDVIQALDLLDECVRGEAAGHYTADEANVPGALLASVVRRALVTTQQLLELPLGPERRPRQTAADAEMISIGALIALRTADRKQRAGSCWACSVAAARRLVVAYVDLLPERLLQQAAQDRRRAPRSHLTCVDESAHRRPARGARGRRR